MKIMIRNSGKLLLLLMLFSMASNVTVAQTNKKKDKEAKKAAEVKSMVETGNYVFHAEFANPMRGGNISLTSEYDLRVSKDTLIAYLPFYGRAFEAPIDPMDGGIHFTSTRFTSTTKVNKKGGWDIYIKTSDAKNVEKLYLSISDDGYASLSVTSSNRDGISFQGYIEQKKQKG